MDVSCNCFGLAASSKVAGKRYNLLVPEIFPKKAPPVNQKLDAGTERKIKKLFEYAEKNPHRNPKISRRLARQVNKELKKANFGQVRVAVAAYEYLLAHLEAELSMFLAKELVVQPVDAEKRRFSRDTGLALQMQTVVGQLLEHRARVVQTMGANLLRHFFQAQKTTDYAEVVESFVPVLCQNAHPGGVVSKAPEDPSNRQLQVACLLALLEYLRFSQRTSYLAHHVRKIQICSLDVLSAHAVDLPLQKIDMRSWLPAQPGGISRGANGPVTAVEATHNNVPTSTVSPEADTPLTVACSLWWQLGSMTQAATDSRRVAEGLLRYLDAGKHWGTPLGKPGLADITISILAQAAGQPHQGYLLFSALIQHVATEGLDGADRAAVMRAAVRQAQTLAGHLGSPALALALKELPRALPPPTSPAPDAQALRQALLAGVADVAACVPSAAYVEDAVADALARLPTSTTPQAERTGTAARSTELHLAGLECMLAASTMAAQQGKQGNSRLARQAFPQQALQQLVRIIASESAELRAAAHALLASLLRISPQGFNDGQASQLLSALWHEVTGNACSPASLHHTEQSYAALVQHASPAACLEACLFLAAIRSAALHQAGHQQPPANGLEEPLLSLHDACMTHVASALQVPGLQMCHSRQPQPIDMASVVASSPVLHAAGLSAEDISQAASRGYEPQALASLVGRSKVTSDWEPLEGQATLDTAGSAPSLAPSSAQAVSPATGMGLPSPSATEVTQAPTIVQLLVAARQGQLPAAGPSNGGLPEVVPEPSSHAKAEATKQAAELSQLAASLLGDSPAAVFRLGVGLDPVGSF